MDYYLQRLKKPLLLHWLFPSIIHQRCQIRQSSCQITPQQATAVPVRGQQGGYGPRVSCGWGAVPASLSPFLDRSSYPRWAALGNIRSSICRSREEFCFSLKDELHNFRPEFLPYHYKKHLVGFYPRLLYTLAPPRILEEVKRDKGQIEAKDRSEGTNSVR